MKWLLMALALAAAGCTTPEGSDAVRVSSIPPGQIIDATYFDRRNAGEIEVFVLSQASGGLLIFYLNGQPVAKLDGGEAIRLYLSPGRYRFGVIPSSHVVLSSLWEMNVDVARNAPAILSNLPRWRSQQWLGRCFRNCPVQEYSSAMIRLGRSRVFCAPCKNGSRRLAMSLATRFA